MRRFVRPDREREFLARFQTEKPIDDEHFKGEILVRVNDDPSLPQALRSWKVGRSNCITYVNIAKWESWETFANHFKIDPSCDPSLNYDPEIELAARQTSILSVRDDDVDLEHDEIVARKDGADRNLLIVDG